MGFIANFLENVKVNELWKPASIDEVMCEVTFWSTLYLSVYRVYPCMHTVGLMWRC